MNSVIPLFSYPLMICTGNYRFTEAEEKFLADLTMAENQGNLMSGNDRILESPELAELKAFIAAQLKVYTSKILKLKQENEIYITQSWSNKTRTDEFHAMHKHPNSLISGVLFVNGDEGDKLPPIRFHRNNDLLPLELEFEEYNDFNVGLRWFDPVKGRLILFPSVLVHDVGRNETAIDRVTLSFNTFIRGPIGNKAQLTEVDIPNR